MRHHGKATETINNFTIEAPKSESAKIAKRLGDQKNTVGVERLASVDPAYRRIELSTHWDADKLSEWVGKLLSSTPYRITQK